MTQQLNSIVSNRVFSNRFNYCLKAAAGRSKSISWQDSHIVDPRKLLLPIDLKKCPLEIFSFINELADARERVLSLDLLHVTEVSDSRTGENAFLAERDLLERLARRFISSKVSTTAHVRVGKPAEEILTHTRETGADLIILSCYTDCAVPAEKLRSPIVRDLISSAPCIIPLLQVRTYFDCLRQWALLEYVVTALDYIGLLKPARRWAPIAS